MCALKVLTVDDSRTVRIIIRKAFKSYDCEIVESANGVEGLAAASKEIPDIILLDVTMPVMDGVEMLTKLKADPKLKNIPVIMLTAEAGREMVLKIAKLGIKDYVVKPFKENVLLEKINQIIDLRPVGQNSEKLRNLDDPCDILIVEDKEAIIDQIREGIGNPAWKIRGVASAAEAMSLCQKEVPDLVVINLGLPNESAFELYRFLKSNNKTKFIPVFSLFVKNALAEQQKAQQLGFNAMVTKPIDCKDFERKIAKAIRLDTSQYYFTQKENHLLIKLSNDVTQSVLNEVERYLKPKIGDCVNNGVTKVIFDISALSCMEMSLVKLLVDAMNICQELTITYLIVGSESIIAECRGFEESKTWTLFNSLEDAEKSELVFAKP